jgi:predicted esterase
VSSIDCHPSVKENAKIKCEQVYKVLLEHGYNDSTIDEDRAKNLQEFLSHSEKRQFYIKNGMALSEHSLYCGCNGAARDN